MRKRPDRWLLTVLLLVLLFSLFTVFAFSGNAQRTVRRLSAASYALYEPTADIFLMEGQADERRPMASTTKIMTAYLAVLEGDPERPVKIPAVACGVEGSSLYLKPGERLTLRELTLGLMLRSANDAALALAIALCGSEEAFVCRMNEKAEELGLSDTHFDNPHGLDGETHYTTAHDLARLAAAALENPAFADIVKTENAVIGKGESRRVLHNHNRLLRMYDGTVGVKTGFTKKSGRCLVSAATRDGVTLVGVTLSAPDDWQDHAQMLDYGFSRLEHRVVAAPGEYRMTLPVIGGTAAAVTVENHDGYEETVDKTFAPATVEIRMCHMTEAPVQEGDILGVVILVRDGKEIARLPLTAVTESPLPRRRRFFGLFGG